MERCVGSNGKYKGQSIKPKITDRSALILLHQEHSCHCHWEQ